jgi:soluble lytic murein transglycosylase-like protein
MEYKKTKKIIKREKIAVCLLAILSLAVLSWSEGWAVNAFYALKGEPAEAMDFKVGLIYEEEPVKNYTGEKVEEYKKNNEFEIIRDEIVKQAEIYGIDVYEAIDIARCESNFRMRVKNPNSSAKGVYQFLDGTWEYINASGHQFDFKENIKQFMIWWPVHPEWWNECR